MVKSRDINYQELLENLSAAQHRLDWLATAKASPDNELKVHKDVIQYTRTWCHSYWLMELAENHPSLAINFINQLVTRFRKQPPHPKVRRVVISSPAVKILSEKHPEKVEVFLNLNLGEAGNARLDRLRQTFPKPTRLNVGVDSGDANLHGISNFTQLAEVRDEARRLLVAREFRNVNFATRRTALALGLKSDGGLAGIVRSLFRFENFQRAVIEPGITNWAFISQHPQMEFIQDLAVLKTLKEVDDAIDRVGQELFKKAAGHSFFVKARMAAMLQISEKTVTAILEEQNLRGWFESEHKKFLEREFQRVDYNMSQLAVLLNVDVRYVTQTLEYYKIKPPIKELASPPFQKQPY
jgi:hypothetical protein